MNNSMKKDNHKNDDSDIVLDPETGSDAGADTDSLDDSVVAEEALGETVKKLRAKIKVLEAERKEYMDGWQRSKAELVNARKRDEEEKKEFSKFATQRVIEDLLPVLESFDMAMGNKEVWNKVDANWRIGVEYIYTQIRKALEDNGLKEINPINQKFDPSRDEATEYVKVSDKEKDHVITEVVSKGYELNGKSLRAPRVKVGSHTE